MAKKRRGRPKKKGFNLFILPLIIGLALIGVSFALPLTMAFPGQTIYLNPGDVLTIRGTYTISENDYNKMLKWWDDSFIINLYMEGEFENEVASPDCFWCNDCDKGYCSYKWRTPYVVPSEDYIRENWMITDTLTNEYEYSNTVSTQIYLQSTSYEVPHLVWSGYTQVMVMLCKDDLLTYPNCVPTPTPTPPPATTAPTTSPAVTTEPTWPPTTAPTTAPTTVPTTLPLGDAIVNIHTYDEDGYEVSAQKTIINIASDDGATWSGVCNDATPISLLHISKDRLPGSVTFTSEYVTNNTTYTGSTTKHLDDGDSANILIDLTEGTPIIPPTATATTPPPPTSPGVTPPPTTDTSPDDCTFGECFGRQNNQLVLIIGIVLLVIGGVGVIMRR